MIGAGFIKDMISSSRDNRNLLKGKNQPTYKNFDKSYITSKIISRKEPVFKKSTPEYLIQLRQKLISENKKERNLRIKIFISSILLSGIITYLVLFH